MCSTPGSMSFDGSIIASTLSTLSCYCIYASGLAVGLDPEGYGNPDFCWISIHEPLIWRFAGPIVLVIVVSVWLLMLPVCFSLRREARW